jgi:S-adenosylmethionine synthetase
MGVGYAHLSDAEEITLEVERRLNSKEFKEEHPEVGTEVKVMTEKKEDSIEVTVACGMVSKLVEDIDEYRELTEIVQKEIEEICGDHGFSEAEVTINNFDNVGDEERSTTHTGTSGTEDEDYPEPYMLISGTHSERGRGQTGRGNRLNGLITPMRPMPM